MGVVGVGEAYSRISGGGHGKVLEMLRVQEFKIEAELKGKIEIEAEVLGQRCRAGVKTRQRWWGKRSEKGEKEYPPAIQWLTCTENMSSAHMPWAFRRYYTVDGRLVITEEKVERHEYFRAHRSDGRLTFQLVPLTGDGVLGDR
ncbi:hypothetical protein RJ640_010926 [Escallonia rubra]|uniref:FAF domain-containing protein n=1 Tax=Escallonia rubra TaxID=112253 RepID=A0AA88ULQ3_9ASTE|nr:hypothetical protein RJ640_010926 [Escallonia rubra]